MDKHAVILSQAIEGYFIAARARRLSPHTLDDYGSQRLLDRIAVIETCADGAAAMQSYQRLHREYPAREFYFVHTAREDLDIRER